MRIKSVLCTAAALATLAVPASALVMQTQSGIMTEDGQDFMFDFTGLPASDGTGAMITISSGPATTGSEADAGFDLDGQGDLGRKEFFVVKSGGIKFGAYSCGGGKGENISGYTMNGAADCVFSLDIEIAGDVFDNLMGDGVFSLAVGMGRGVGSFGDGDQLNVTLSYEEVAAVPLPASGLLLLGGIAAVGAAARRRKAAS